ncbi:hypothetical protein L210DRAFT_3650533 [Boletus edulis BED1]|uniref:F-box domain-containing protein n=1 Tax=Boletus edulis BED1 TaxID=1328754 RepID=A0AAD4G9D3_BOLED|nr:hypothetical protein L210DRAFT_3650533 [Boletus edulis BED1]
MPHLPSDVNLSPIDTMRVLPEARQPLDHIPIVPSTEAQDQSIDTIALRLTKEEFEHMARHPTRQDVPPTVTVEPTNRLQELLQRRSPVTRLPPEILAHIFELYVVRLSELTPGSVPAQGPFCLTQVCTLWRSIAESYPHLWTSIHFYFPESQQNREEDTPNVGLVFDLHLKRSGVLPISLTFTDHRMYHFATEDLISMLADRLRTHAQRWKRITLHMSCAYFPLLFTFTPCDLSSLEHLYISGDVLGRQPMVLRLDLESATNLKSFAYSGPGQSADDEIHLCWENLAEVAFEFVPHNGTSFTLARQFRNLVQCQNITTCSLGIDRTPWHLNDGQFITLPHLQTLRVRRLSPYAQVRGAIDLLVLPQLQTLEIDASVLISWNQRWHNRHFSSLLARSGCSLLHLSIQDVDFPNDELMRCLALSPSLTSFRFIPCPRSQNISDIIREIDVSRIPTNGQTLEHANTGPLVPQLREITLASSVKKYLDQMLRMFRSRVGARARAAGVATLRRADAVFFDLWHDTDMNRLEKVASFHAGLARWSTSMDKERDHEDMLETSVVVNSPYLPEYIDVQ